MMNGTYSRWHCLALLFVAAGHESVRARPDHPGAKFNLALAQALNGESDEALLTLDSLLAVGIDFGADELDKNGFDFVANSHWNRFDRENRLPEGLSGPVILKIRLGGT